MGSIKGGSTRRLLLCCVSVVSLFVCFCFYFRFPFSFLFGNSGFPLIDTINFDFRTFCSKTWVDKSPNMPPKLSVICGTKRGFRAHLFVNDGLHYRFARFLAIGGCCCATELAIDVQPQLSALALVELICRFVLPAHSLVNASSRTIAIHKHGFQAQSPNFSNPRNHGSTSTAGLPSPISSQKQLWNLECWISRN